MSFWTKIKAAFGVVPHSVVAKTKPSIVIIKKQEGVSVVDNLIAERAKRKRAVTSDVIGEP